MALSITVPKFLEAKQTGRSLTMLTCYDAAFARILNKTALDAILVGDSLMMVVYGEDTTLGATPEIIAQHVKAVSRSAPDKFIVADMPFLATRQGKAHATRVAQTLVQAGAHAIKIEGVEDQEDVLKHLIKSGIPVMGHLGLTPQFVHAFGGMRVQAKSEAEGNKLIADMKTLEELGAFSSVLECVPASLATKVTKSVRIPVIGIGAGIDVDGQILVLHDLLGFRSDFKPKFLRNFANLEEHIGKSVNDYIEAVDKMDYPNSAESYQTGPAT